MPSSSRDDLRRVADVTDAPDDAADAEVVDEVDFDDDDDDVFEVVGAIAHCSLDRRPLNTANHVTTMHVNNMPTEGLTVTSLHSTQPVFIVWLPRIATRGI